MCHKKAEKDRARLACVLGWPKRLSGWRGALAGPSGTVGGAARQSWQLHGNVASKPGQLPGEFCPLFVTHDCMRAGSARDTETVTLLATAADLGPLSTSATDGCGASPAWQHRQRGNPTWRRRASNLTHRGHFICFVGRLTSNGGNVRAYSGKPTRPPSVP